MRQRLALLACASAPLLLAACGGGGDSPTATAPAPAAAGAPVVALSVLPAPTLPPAALPIGSGLFDCRNLRIGAVEIDSVRVPSGAACVLDGTGLIGSIIVEPGAVLDARNVRVRGNVQADGATAVLIAGNSAITGSVQLVQGGAATLVNAQVGGDLQIAANRGALLAQDNRVTGNVQVEDNTGGVTLNANVIGGNLQCKQNQPAPTGSGNRAAALQDQCANLAPAATPPTPVPPTPPVTPPPTLPPLANPPAGGTVTCRDASLGAVNVDTVVVPANARCTLTGTRLIGSLLVEQGAQADVRDAVINGNVQAERATRVAIAGASRIGGSVQIVQSGAAIVDGATITGDIQLTGNAGMQWLQANRVGGSVQVNENRGGALLYDNRIVGNLQCGQNQPAPDGRGNSAALKEGQCEAL
jgi:hypothetical protein